MAPPARSIAAPSRKLPAAWCCSTRCLSSVPRSGFSDLTPRKNSSRSFVDSFSARSNRTFSFSHWAILLLCILCQLSVEPCARETPVAFYSPYRNVKDLRNLFDGQPREEFHFYNSCLP